MLLTVTTSNDEKNPGPWNLIKWPNFHLKITKFMDFVCFLNGMYMKLSHDKIFFSTFVMHTKMVIHDVFK